MNCSADGCQTKARTLGLCSKHYRRHLLAQKTDLCAVEGCSRTVVTRGFCDPHYLRWNKTGDTLAHIPIRKQASHGSGHIAPSGYRYSARELVHRLVLREAIGEGPHPCRWCGLELHWDVQRFDRSKLTVDHIDADKLNNDPSNLVPSCRVCNAARGGAARIASKAQG